jgi:hypothetical protein
MCLFTAAIDHIFQGIIVAGLKPQAVKGISWEKK